MTPTQRRRRTCWIKRSLPSTELAVLLLQITTRFILWELTPKNLNSWTRGTSGAETWALEELLVKRRKSLDRPWLISMSSQSCWRPNSALTQISSTFQMASKKFSQPRTKKIRDSSCRSLAMEGIDVVTDRRTFSERASERPPCRVRSCRETSPFQRAQSSDFYQ